MAGEDGWQIDQARLLLLAAAGREPSHAAALWEHVVADCGAAVASGVAEVWVGKQIRQKRGKRWTGV